MLLVSYAFKILAVVVRSIIRDTNKQEIIGAHTSLAALSKILTAKRMLVRSTRSCASHKHARAFKILLVSVPYNASHDNCKDFKSTDFKCPCMHRIHNKAGREGMPQSVLEGMRFSLNLFWLKKALKVAKKSGDPVPAGIKSPKITRSFKPRKKSVLPSIAARLKIRVVS